MKKILLLSNDDKIKNQIGQDIYDFLNKQVYLIDVDDFQTVDQSKIFEKNNSVILSNTRQFQKRNPMGINEFVKMCTDNDLFVIFVSTDTMAMPNTMYINLEGVLEDVTYYLYNSEWRDYDILLDMCKMNMFGEEEEDDTTISSPKKGK